MEMSVDHVTNKCCRIPQELFFKVATQSLNNRRWFACKINVTRQRSNTFIKQSNLGGVLKYRLISL